MESNTAHVLHLLDSEIEEIQSAEARNGLNLWVVLAAIVGLLWILTGELRAGSANWVNITRLLFAQSLFIDGLRWLYVGLSNQPRDTNEVRFHWSHYVLGTRRAFAAIEVLRCIVLLSVAFLSHAFSWRVLIPIGVFYFVYLFIMVIVFAGSFSPLFVVSPDARNNFTYLYWGLLFGSLILSFAFLFPLLPLPTPDSMSGYRISGLIVGTGYLLIMFGFVLSSSSLVPTLVTLRRRLATRKISLDDAVHEIEITLGGMQETDALRADYLALVELLDAMDQQTNNALMAISSIESNLPVAEDAPQIAASKRDTINSLVAGYRFFLNERLQLFNRYIQQISRFSKLARKIKVIASTRSTVGEIERLINTRAASADQNFAYLTEREAEVDKKLKPPEDGGK